MLSQKGQGLIRCRPRGVGNPHSGLPASPLFLEKFDTGVGYDLSGWTENLNAGIINEDYVGIILDGTQSLRLVTAGGTTWFQRGVTATNHIWMFFNIQFTTLSIGEKSIIEFQTAVSAVLGKVVASTAGLKAYANGGTSGVTLDVVTTGVKYWVWVEFDNSGASTLCNVGFSTNGVRPTSGNKYKASSGPLNATACEIVAVGVAGSDFGTDVEFIYDYVLADDAQIGDNP